MTGRPSPGLRRGLLFPGSQRRPHGGQLHPSSLHPQLGLMGVGGTTGPGTGLAGEDGGGGGGAVRCLGQQATRPFHAWGGSWALPALGLLCSSILFCLSLRVPMSLLRVGAGGLSAERRGPGVSQTREWQGWGCRKNVRFRIIKVLWGRLGGSACGASECWFRLRVVGSRPAWGPVLSGESA